MSKPLKDAQMMLLKTAGVRDQYNSEAARRAYARIIYLESENATLREALEKYGYHNRDCYVIIDSEERGGLGIADCNCGLDAALKKPEACGPEPEA